MTVKTLFSSTTFLKSIFAGTLFLLIFISSINYKHLVSLNDSSQWVMRSYAMQIELEQLISLVKDAETGQRGFMLTNDTTFLQFHADAPEKIKKKFKELRILAADNRLQIRNLDTLSLLIDARFRAFSNSLSLNASVSFSIERLNYSLLQEKNIMDVIRKRVDDMISLENAYLKERQAKYQNNISFTPLFTLLTLFFSIAIFAFAYVKITNDFNDLKKTNEVLTITTESIDHAEKIGDFSTWQWDLDTNKLIYSDNQYLLLGCEPQSFEPTIENYLQFVHPDDRHIITEGGEAVKDNNYPSAFFRIIRRDGTLRYFKSIAKELTNTQGKKILIGMNMDVTEQHLNQLVLEEKNHDLELRNQELADFNRIASHDLQEPLRKIQTFISRISEKETNSLSASGKEYFEKIQASTHRMRLLIDDLLLFSRTNKNEKAFEATDLTLLLDIVKQELAEIILEKNAVVASPQLPTLRVIPFQIQQLFMNIIGNALKYSKPDTPPQIVLNCIKICAKNEPILATQSDKNYYKITVADNGLGFEPQYAEKIFTLFHRLHAVHQYPGTGIGLAICRKIVDNHAGFIVAEGTPNQGATFTIFLPA